MSQGSIVKVFKDLRILPIHHLPKDKVRSEPPTSPPMTKTGNGDTAHPLRHLFIQVVAPSLIH